MPTLPRALSTQVFCYRMDFLTGRSRIMEYTTKFLPRCFIGIFRSACELQSVCTDKQRSVPQPVDLIVSDIRHGPHVPFYTSKQAH